VSGFKGNEARRGVLTQGRRHASRGITNGGVGPELGLKKKGHAKRWRKEEGGPLRGWPYATRAVDNQQRENTGRKKETSH